ncbi:hypothetical protein SLEP1_g33517 [Rubroshorea leprosula]|uniref:Uncharacterized protein n=1 Tax=Rubroshorea leprosula TaxID=152421 RepID=A0AAV5KGU8_9ROSI|nr:hypothetical protein SLEP1_g33517 [Rubroshorea leprosula]
MNCQMVSSSAIAWIGRHCHTCYRKVAVFAHCVRVLFLLNIFFVFPGVNRKQN